MKLSTIHKPMQRAADVPVRGSPGARARLDDTLAPSAHLGRCDRGRSRSASSAFTMVEIAICIAILGFALVAIIGVLPTGIKVQKENKEETVIHQEGLFLLEAIRSGSRALDELTNYIDVVTISNVLTRVSTDFRSTDPLPPNLPRDITRGGVLIGRLTTPKYETIANRLLVREVSAQVRSLTGAAIDKDSGNRQFAFRYQLTSEIIPLEVLPPEVLDYRLGGLSPADKTKRYNQYLVATNISANFYEVRLTLRWPLVPRGSGFAVVGNNEKVFRTTVSGRLIPVLPLSQAPLYFLDSESYAQLQPAPVAP